MTPDDPISSKLFRITGFVFGIVFLTSCATQPLGQPEDALAAQRLRAARSQQLSPEVRAAKYLEAAALTVPDLGSGHEPTVARQTYNAASAELTSLLRSAEGGRLWNHPLTLTADNSTYHLSLQQTGPSVWSPNYFTSFRTAAEIKHNIINKEIIQEGVGGALVGVRSTNPREAFAPPRGIVAPVTATLDFKGSNASLALRRPNEQITSAVEGKMRPLAADFSAPLSYYQPPRNVLLVGLMGTLRSAKYMDRTGLYFLQPYDPNRIPVVFVHGLASTPFTWMETMNGLQADPEIRKRYQFWVFAYPTGNPILYSALQLRQQLAKVDKLYPNHQPYVLVGHSMGGIVSHAQVTAVTKGMWENQLGETAKDIFARNSPDSLIARTMVFEPNPRIGRVVFVCTPHRGSEMATGGLGRFGISLISLPFTLAKVVTDSITSAELVRLTGSSKRLPNSVSGLRPSNPAFVVVNSAKITTPFHSIIGDRGKGNSPKSTDGVVPYWSSHFDGAKSEVIVPGPHSSCALPETITELNRILTLHLKRS